MYWVILISFLILLAISFVVSNPENKLIKNKKNKIHLLDYQISSDVLSAGVMNFVRYIYTQHYISP
ncbi:hypothetical protein [Candidatus Pelagibacter sp. Uisw_127]|uniref:hypothetical protein n=1 Tax=Candidatus Pelagibacter sp. Uisw_127 TaxID=3230988 RepID=UPI0039E86F55